MSIKKWFFTVAVVVAAVALNAQDGISLADARASIGDCIKTPSSMTETMKKLSAEDQKAFIGEVNEAIAAMPGSNESQAATFLNVNRAALKGASKGNLATLVAEVFATVPPEFLPVISDSFASDLFNRSADPSVTYTDQQYITIASNTMVKVSERMADVDNGAARATFAAVMLIKASNITPDGQSNITPDSLSSTTPAGQPGTTFASLVDALVSTLPADSQDAARNDWIPTATSSGESQSYEPLVEAAGATEGAPSSSVVIRIAGPQVLDAMLGDLNGGKDSSIVGSVFRSDREQPTLPVKDTQPEVVVIEDGQSEQGDLNIKEDQGYQNQF